MGTIEWNKKLEQRHASREHQRKVADFNDHCSTPLPGLN
jgi:hypothetical protein